MEFQKVIKDDSSVLMFAKMQCEGHGTGLEKSDWLKIIEGRSRDLYGDAKTPAIAFTKTIVEDETGRLLYKAMKAAPGFETTSAVGDTPEVEHPDDFKGRPAHAMMHALALEHQKKHAGMSYQSAYSVLYTKPEHAALRDEIKREHMKEIMDRAHA
jgi:hypothetical protein